jgi:hypothetical protein
MNNVLVWHIRITTTTTRLNKLFAEIYFKVKANISIENLATRAICAGHLAS